MKGTVKFSKEFVTPIGTHEWLSVELPIGEKIESEVIRQSFEDAQNAVMEFHKQSNQGMLDNSIAPGPTQIPVINKADERIAIDIENATTMEQLMKVKYDLSSPYLAELFAQKLTTINK